MIHSIKLVSLRDLGYRYFPKYVLCYLFLEGILKKYVFALRAESASFVSESELKLHGKPATGVEDRDNASVHWWHG